VRSSHAMLRSCEGPASRRAAAGQQGVAADEGRRSRYALPLAFAAEHRYVGQTPLSAPTTFKLETDCACLPPARRSITSKSCPVEP